MGIAEIISYANVTDLFEAKDGKELGGKSFFEHS